MREKESVYITLCDRITSILEFDELSRAT
jgi:hypothetical protein